MAPAHLWRNHLSAPVLFCQEWLNPQGEPREGHQGRSFHVLHTPHKLPILMPPTLDGARLSRSSDSLLLHSKLGYGLLLLCRPPLF